MKTTWWGRLLLAATLAVAVNGCASNPPPPPVGLAPKYPGYPTPDIPASLQATADVTSRHEVAWRRLQAGDLGGAKRDFSEILRRLPGFYPATTGLGFAALADRDPKTAVTRFAAAIAVNDRYLPAWIGKVEAELGAGNDANAIAALEQILAIDPRREADRSRLDLLRFRQVQALIESGRKARQAGRLADAERDLQQALTLSPSSTAILRELVLVEVKSGASAQAEAHAHRIVQLEPDDAEAHASLADMLEARKDYAGAIAELSKAVAIDPRPEWRKRVADLRANARLAAIPEEYRDTASRPAVTRAEVAAYIGIKLGDLVEQAPAHPATVATDLRGHWAAPWITPVTRAGVMSVFPNHTFQPAATVRRNDLAEIVSELIALAVSRQPAQLAKWRAARPAFADVSASNVFYRAVALSVAAGALSADTEGRFRPTSPATGADLVAAVARVDALAPQ